MHIPWFQTELASSPKENFSATSFLVPFLRKKRNALSWRATESRCGGKEGRLSRLLFASHSLRSYIYYYRQFLFQFSYVSVVPPRRSPDKMSGPPRWLTLFAKPLLLKTNLCWIRCYVLNIHLSTLIAIRIGRAHV